MANQRENAKQKAQQALIEDILRAYTRCKCVRLVNRGNAAILCALVMVQELSRKATKAGRQSSNTRNVILVPDQGGWISFETYPPLLGFEVELVKTNRGIIDITNLEEKSKSAAALIVTSFAGYFAEQPIAEIAGVCHKNGCLIIEDASGSLGDAVLCDGRVVDIIVGSFGNHKPVNNGYGGFVATNNKELFDIGSIVFSMTNFYPDYAYLLEKLKEAPARIAFFFEKQAAVKHDIKKLDVEIIHPALRGLNVAVKPKNSNDRKRILEYCKKEEFETVQCPKYIRVNEEAVCIELKRLP
ncbi:DegT/DnrJ/EryC1/StrS family aminotransferase [Candidatus Woesearchaeota archaeon]|nr:DegT/DnrJ/EryC1/StrS family aminotransferase [Candidatus Woesearchaeota archaeon]